MENQLLLIPADCYSIDTNVFIEIWDSPSIYSRAKMPELWAHIESLVYAGRMIATKEVYEELKRHASPDLMAWLRAHKTMFVETPRHIELAQMIINDFYTQYKDGYKPEVANGADPFVVAVAMDRPAVVFTLEHEQPRHVPAETNVPKIPSICAEYKVECVNFESFITREGFKISMTDSTGAIASGAQRIISSGLAA